MKNWIIIFETPRNFFKKNNLNGYGDKVSDGGASYRAVLKGTVCVVGVQNTAVKFENFVFCFIRRFQRL